MEIAIIGLGKMGLNMANRLSQHGINVIGFDIGTIPSDQLPSTKFYLASSLSDLIQSIPTPRIVWLMLPSGIHTENIINELQAKLTPGDTIIDGGNSNYKDTQRRGIELNSRGYKFIDVGVSGGIWGLVDGYCLMVGGQSEEIDKLTPIFNALSTNNFEGWSYLGPLGAGHYAKMIHNGIEYGIMQSIAEGLELSQSNHELSIDTKKMVELWRHGSVVRSRLLDMLCHGMESNPNLDEVLPFVPDSGEGRWFAIEAIERGIPTPTITQALNARFQSQDNIKFSFKILSIMRNAFGGHKIYKK